MSTYLDANNETCNLPLVLVIPQLLQWYVELVLSHFLDNKGCPKLYISNQIRFRYVVDPSNCQKLNVPNNKTRNI
jgi:hypothetical protein